MNNDIILQNEEENVTIVTFDMTGYGGTIKLKNLTGVTSIDWGDGTVNNELSHNYSAGSCYTCKIYNITSIGADAFRQCNYVISVVIGTGVTMIESSAFMECCNLKEITISDSVTSISGYAFKGCSSLTSVNIPNGVTGISSNTFCGCSSLKSITIPESLKLIEEYAFLGTRPQEIFLKSSLLLDDMISLYRLVESKNSIVYVPIELLSEYKEALGHTCDPENIIGLNYDDPPISLEGLKTYHTQLREVYITPFEARMQAAEKCINRTIADIENDATAVTFDIAEENTKVGFKSLSGMTEIYWGDGIVDTKTTHIYAKPGIYTCKIYGLTSAAFTDLDPAWKVEHNSSKITSVRLGKNITRVRDGALYGARGLKEIILTDSITDIGSNAFVGCENLTNITIPNSVVSIGSHAFNGCTSLKEICIGKNITSIGSDAFSSCTGVETIYFDAEGAAVGKDVFNNVGRATDGVKVVFGKYVTKVPNDLFNVNIEESYLSTFKAKIHHIAFEADSCCTEIGEKAFYYLPIVSCELPSTIKSIGNHAFDSCTSLNSLEIPYGVETIGDYAFRWTGLKKLVIPDSVTSIGEGIITYNGNLTDLVIPFIGPNKESSGSYQFVPYLFKNHYSNSVSISNITVSGGSLAQMAFDLCGAGHITLGPNVTSIANMMLLGYRGTVEFIGSAPPTFAGSITSAMYPYKLIVPCEAKEAYKAVLSSFDKQQLDNSSSSTKLYKHTITGQIYSGVNIKIELLSFTGEEVTEVDYLDAAVKLAIAAKVDDKPVVDCVYNGSSVTFYTFKNGQISQSIVNEAVTITDKVVGL